MSDTVFRFPVRDGRWVEICATGGLLTRSDVEIIDSYLSVLKGSFEASHQNGTDTSEGVAERSRAADAGNGRK